MEEKDVVKKKVKKSSEDSSNKIKNKKLSDDNKNDISAKPEKTKQMSEGMTKKLSNDGIENKKAVVKRQTKVVPKVKSENAAENNSTKKESTVKKINKQGNKKTINKTTKNVTSENSTVKQDSKSRNINKITEEDKLNQVFEKSAQEIKSKSTKVSVPKKTSTQTKKTTSKKVDAQTSVKKKANSKPVAKSPTSKQNIISTPKSNSIAKKTVIAKAAGVKQKISEEVAKTTGETSSKIKLNKKEKKEDYKKEININSIEDEMTNKFDIKEFDEELKKRKQIPKEELIKIIKKSFSNMIYAVIFIIFLLLTNFGFYNFPKTAFIKDLNIFAFVFLGTSIMLIESSYKKEDLAKCINGIETVLMGIFTVTLPYIYQIYKTNFINTLKIAGLIIFVYYLIKSSIVFFNIKNKYLRAKEDFTKDENVGYDLDDDDDEEN